MRCLPRYLGGAGGTMGARLGVGAWLVAWAALFVAQCWLGVTAQGANAAVAPEIAAVLIALLQLVKVPLAARRLHDLGRSADDAVLTLMPVANIGLWSQLTRKAPSEKKREALLQAIGGEISARAAFRQALSQFIGLLPAFLPFILVGGALAAVVDVLAERSLTAIAALPKVEQAAIQQVAWGVTGVLSIYALLQLAKRHRATRASWLPVLLLVPAALFALMVQLHDEKGLGLLVVTLPYQALDLLWGSFVGGTLAVAWTYGADRARRGEAVSAAALWSRVRTHAVDAIAVHGAVYHFVTVGLQVLVPGVHYALVYSFADFHAVYEPEQSALARSSQLSHGIRRRLFIAQYLGVLVYLTVSLLVWAVLADVRLIGAGLFDPTVVPLSVNLALGPVWVATVALIKVTLYLIWRERMDRSAVTMPSSGG